LVVRIGRGLRLERRSPQRRRNGLPVEDRAICCDRGYLSAAPLEIGASLRRVDNIPSLRTL
jgi:hypothetical protein